MQPGQSWNSYYQTASCGEVINVASGHHGNQAIRENSTLSQCSSNVVFQAAPGADVAVNDINSRTLAAGTPRSVRTG